MNCGSLNMNKQYQDHFICLQQLHKNQWIIVFRRNNMSKQLFNYEEKNKTYSYNEKYIDSNCQVSFHLTIESSVFYDLFSAECNYFRALGGNNSFDITIQTRPFSPYDIMYKSCTKHVSENKGVVSYWCSFKGFFHVYQLFNIKWNQIDINDQYNKLNPMNKYPKKKVNNKTIEKIPGEKIKKSTPSIDIKVVKDCIYFKNKICIYFNDTCNPYSFKCKMQYKVPESKAHISPKANNIIIPNNKPNLSHNVKEQPLKTIVLYHNRKCVYEEHHLSDINAVIRILIANSKIANVPVLAAHCKECNQHIILKSDFKKFKQRGILLCQVIDETPEHLAKHKHTTYSATESRIHSLGYNVIKQYGYTFEQRKMILANIMENYNITKHEILSMLDTNIARKTGLPNYTDAVDKWQQDREFVTNYEMGDIPEIIVDKVTIGSRK